MNRYCSKCGSEKLCLYTTNGVNLVLRCNDCKADYGTVGILPETVDILNWMIDSRLKEIKELPNGVRFEEGFAEKWNRCYDSEPDFNLLRPKEKKE